MSGNESTWSRKGATLSDKSLQEFGLTQQAIIEVFRAGKHQLRQHNMHVSRPIHSEMVSLIAKKRACGLSRYADALKKRTTPNS